jgi:hypothetical protein
MTTMRVARVSRPQGPFEIVELLALGASVAW